jgi:glycerate kinase
MMRAGHVVVAPDKFKGSLTAPQAAAHVDAGLRRSRPDLDVRLAPVADGGEGTLDAVLARGFERVTRTVSGPTGQPVEAVLAVREGTAVVELAQASGLQALPGGRRDALRATSLGTGQLVRAALDAGCRSIVLGLGGSACTDGGAGMLQALGVRLLDRSGRDLEPGGAELLKLQRISLDDVDERLADTRFTVAGDVDNPLLGEHGAAAVYAPQKGASADDVRLLERALHRWADVAMAALDTDAASRPGAGAAGGVGFAAMAFLGATLRPGIDVVLDLIEFETLLPGARLVVTGEGSLDAQTLRGKAPAGVARAAQRHGVATVAVAGRSLLTAAQLHEGSVSAAYALTDLEPDVDRCMAEAGPLLERLGAAIAADWLHEGRARTAHRTGIHGTGIQGEA